MNGEKSRRHAEHQHHVSHMLAEALCLLHSGDVAFSGRRCQTLTPEMLPIQVERVTQEVPFTRADCSAFPDAEEAEAAERLSEAALEQAPPDLPLMSAMAAAHAAAGAAAIASAQVGALPCSGTCSHQLLLQSFQSVAEPTHESAETHAYRHARPPLSATNQRLSHRVWRPLVAAVLGVADGAMLSCAWA